MIEAPLEDALPIEALTAESVVRIPYQGQDGQNCNQLQLSVKSLDHSIDYEIASRCIRVLDGRIAVEMLGKPSQVGAIELPPRVGGHLAPDVGVVLASQAVAVGGERLAIPMPQPGAVVLVRPYDGIQIDFADCGAYEPVNQVRVYGACMPISELIPAEWWDSVVCELSVIGGRVRLSHPCGDKIVLKLDPVVETDGGIILTDLAKYRSGMATVYAVGPMEKDVKPGDRVSVNIEALLQTGLGLDLSDDRDLAVANHLAINYVLQ